jgi:hypothetical protein
MVEEKSGRCCVEFRDLDDGSGVKLRELNLIFDYSELSFQLLFA